MYTHCTRCTESVQCTDTLCKYTLEELVWDVFCTLNVHTLYNRCEDYVQCTDTLCKNTLEELVWDVL